MTEETKGMYVFSSESVQTGPDGRPTFTRGLDSKAVRAGLVPMSKLEENMGRFLDGTQSLLEKGTKKKGDFKVSTVEVYAQISADGKIGFLGSGAGVSGEAGIKFVFTRE